MSRNKDWETQVREHKRQMDIWNELLPDGFQDAEITENLTGKAAQLPTSAPPKGRSSID